MRSVRWVALAMLAGLWAPLLQAAICIDSTNDLAAAFLLAQNQAVDIQLVKGTYRLDLTPWTSGLTVAPGFTLTGGYDPGCASRDIDPASTLLKDDGASHVYQPSPAGDFAIDGVKFQLAGGFDVYAGGSSDATVTIRHVEFGGSSDDARLVILWFGENGTNGTVRVVDALFHGSLAGWCGLDGEPYAGNVDYTFVNVTSVGNGYGICTLDHTPSQIATFHIYNSIAYGSTAADFDTTTQSVTLVDDIFGTQTKPGPLFPAPIGVTSGDPQLNASYVPIAPGSPAIDSGTQIVPGGLPATDIAGSPRVVGGDVDRGAYETSYDSSTVQTVDNTNNSGAGSLRAAIHNANLTAGKNTIKFAIGSGCAQVKVIQIDSNLEAISGDTTINGYSQVGATRNTLDFGVDANICIVLEPSASSTATDGLRVASGAAAGVNLTVTGLAIGGFPQDGISLLGGSAHNVNGNHFGGSVGGHALAANGVNVRIGSDVHGVTVGGDGAGQRNVIGAATNAGVFVAGGATPAHDNQIVNNYIGLGWSDGFINRGNGTNGVYLAGADNTLTGNWIGYNGSDGIDVDGSAATGNVITGNFIGGARELLPNGLAGVRFENAASDNTLSANTIVGNTNAGVRVVSGQRNSIRKNSISTNGALGIDLAVAGITANDNDAGIMAVDYGNRGQNFPVLDASSGGGTYTGTVSGSLPTTPGDYTIDLYVQGVCDGSGNGEGARWLRSASVNVPPPPSGPQGTGPFSLHNDFGLPLPGQFITATATDALGNTSEFSACAAYTDYTIFKDGFEPAPP